MNTKKADIPVLWNFDKRKSIGTIQSIKQDKEGNITYKIKIQTKHQAKELERIKEISIVFPTGKEGITIVDRTSMCKRLAVQNQEE